MVPMLKAQKMEGQIQLTAMKLERVDMKLTSAATIASLGEDNDAEKSLPPRTKRVPRKNTAVMKKKPLRHLPPMKEEVRKIGQSLKRLLEGIDPVRELISTDRWTVSGVACHHRLWPAHTVERRRVWHAIIAFGQHTRSNDIGRGMPSSPLGSTHSWTTSGMA